MLVEKSSWKQSRDFAWNKLRDLPGIRPASVEGFYPEEVEGVCPESVGRSVPGISWTFLSRLTYLEGKKAVGMILLGICQGISPGIM